MSATKSKPRDPADLILSGKASSGLRVDGKLNLAGARALDKLPAGLACYELDASRTNLVSLPGDLSVECVLTLEGCHRLKSLPANLKVGTLNTAPRGYFGHCGGCRRCTRPPS